MPETPEHPLIVVGAGQAGLATAHAAARRGVRALVLEAAADVGGSWPHYYDSLTLFSPARFSALPGRALPGEGDRYPLRDEITAYLRAYAADLDADIRCRRKAAAVQAGPGGFTVTTTEGERFTGAALVAATGAFSRPHRPALPGLGTFTGTVLHTADYRRPEPFAGQRVVVVGGGNSGVQIAAELAAVARVSLASRSPIAWANRRLLGRDLHWWFVRSGLDAAPLRRVWEKGPTLVNDDGRHRAAFATGNPDRREMFTRLSGSKAEWADGTVEEVDTLVLATGYRPALDYLADTGALDGQGRPLHRGGVSTTVPGLGYVGLEFQRGFGSATLRGVGRDARHVLRRLRVGAGR
ncbi:flavin-containing monooxygenase [Streptomonospora nanhaiensis]|uniref:Putative flavoprotein involved in K+ transport n=1 Tax=Streptomonospora nanhaiensis TaxID=1323731 RepID=A0A853BNV9_9ACTN|nr:NAD(P)-binding domain-containing protein [Streptomonospora nanhaiensis]MBV2361978.1 NAD(P)-binding domain-containing protein [Streptomonospora nanhaiensis]MBX9386789.1 NAD(P)-binding domain-containing protein [Streptomonospora nanhaiensis]NYI96201.1 putative flavoprotein involved in K+ transport [Streptomonospora nanhaiensis]